MAWMPVLRSRILLGQSHERLQQVGGTFCANQGEADKAYQFTHIQWASDIKAIERIVEEKCRAKRCRNPIQHGEKTAVEGRD